MISTELHKILEKDRTQLDALAALLSEEKTCLQNRDLEKLSTLLQQKQTLIASLERDDSARRQLLTKAGLPDNQTSLPQLRALLAGNPQYQSLAVLIESIEMRLQNCRELTETNAIIVHRSRLNTQRMLSILRGPDVLSNLYTSHGNTTGSPVKRDLGSA